MDGAPNRTLFQADKAREQPLRGLSDGLQPAPRKVSGRKKIAFLSKFFFKTLADSKNSRTFATAIEKQRLQRE